MLQVHLSNNQINTLTFTIQVARSARQTMGFRSIRKMGQLFVGCRIDSQASLDTAEISSVEYVILGGARKN